MLVPVLDYAAVCYHSLLSERQSLRLESAQKLVLRIIHGYDISYNELLEKSDCERLKDRRLRLIDKFLSKAVENDRFSAKWFPKRTFVHFDLRQERFYEEKYARTSRLYNSPLYFFRRRLNETFIRDEKKGS